MSKPPTPKADGLRAMREAKVAREDLRRRNEVHRAKGRGEPEPKRKAPYAGKEKPRRRGKAKPKLHQVSRRTGLPPEHDDE